MNRIAVESSQIKSAGHNPETRTMEVEFKSGAVYLYNDVSAETFLIFMAAESKGRHFRDHIKGKYETRKLPPEPVLTQNEVDFFSGDRTV